MKLKISRHTPGLTCTIGDLLINDAIFCATLEDPIREVPGLPVAGWKVPGDTAIPSGTYSVDITYSPRFNEDLPLVMGVPGFAGIRFHAGNTSADTEGCILVGTWNGGEFITNSRKALQALMAMLEVAHIAKQPITLEVENP